MTVSDAGAHQPPARLVLAALGTLPPLAAVAERLAALTGLPLAAIPDPDQPDAALAALQPWPGGWLAPLPTDLGLPLPAGGSWAEALGAWRQPTLLVLSAEQLATGLPAAGHALLRQWRVPTLGLLQWGGRWEEAARRRDGLPWLGVMAASQAANPGPDPALDQEEQARLAIVLRLGWSRLDLDAETP